MVKTVFTIYTTEDREIRKNFIEEADHVSEKYLKER